MHGTTVGGGGGGVLDESCIENQNTHFMFNILFRKSCRLLDNVEKIL